MPKLSGPNVRVVIDDVMTPIGIAISWVEYSMNVCLTVFERNSANIGNTLERIKLS